MADNSLFIDRNHKLISNVTLRKLIGIWMFRLAYRLSLPFGNIGISRMNHMIGKAFMGNEETVFALNADTQFTIPSGDYYWSLLYNPSYIYERELKRALWVFRGIDYQFLDLGANYGYWSILASSQEFGAKPVISCEASSESFCHLIANAKQRSGLIVPHNGAVWSASGKIMEIFGTRHAGRTLMRERSRQQNVERVITVTVADLISAYSKHFDSKNGEMSRLVLKLDVEGAELAVMQGAAKVMDDIDVIIFEESNNASFGETFLKIREMTGFVAYFFDGKSNSFIAVGSPYEIYDPRGRRRAVQSVGYNFIAIRPESSFEKAILDS